MQVAVRERFEAVLGLGTPLEWLARPAPECVPCGVPEVDSRHRRPAARLADGDLRTGVFRADQPALFHPRGSHGAPGGLRAGGRRRCLRPSLRRRFRRSSGPPGLGALLAQRRACAPGGRSAGAGRRFRSSGHGFRRYAAGHRAPHFAYLVVPVAPRHRAYARRARGAGPPIQRQNLRQPDAGLPAGGLGAGGWGLGARE